MTQSIAIPEKIRREVFAMADRGESCEAMSQYMASAKLEKILAIRLLADAAHLRLGEAKKVIHTSPAWQFRRTSDDDFHSEVYRVAQEWNSSHAEPGTKPLKSGTR